MPRTTPPLDDQTDDCTAAAWRERLLALVDLALESRLRFELSDRDLAADRLELLCSRADQLAGRLRTEPAPPEVVPAAEQLVYVVGSRAVRSCSIAS